MAKKSAKNPKPKADDPLKQYVILDPENMKTPFGRFLFIPIDTKDTANRTCWAIGLAAYADALKCFGRNNEAVSVVRLAAEMVNDIKMKHPELFNKVAGGPYANNKRSGKPSS